MSAENRELVRANGVIAPQYYNSDTDRYEFLQGIGGAAWYRVRGTVVKDVINDDENVTKNYPDEMYGFSIVNDGTSDLTFNINGLEIIVKENEAFSNLFDGFTQIEINASDDFRAVVMQ